MLAIADKARSRHIADKATSRRFRTEPSSSSQVRAFLHHELGHEDLPATTLFDVLLAVSEAANNAIDHGAPHDDGSFEVSLALEPDWIRIEVVDVGRFTTNVSEPERGFGFSMMESTMDVVDLQSRGERTSVSLSKRIVRH